MAEKWYDKSIKQTETRLNTKVDSGLSRAEVLKRRKKLGTNEIYPVQRTSFKTYLKHLATDFTSILLAFTVIIAALFDQGDNLLIILGILAVYYILAIFIYVKAQRVLEGMGSHALPNAKVMREGRLYMVRQEQLVPGDIIFLATGDIVPADARLYYSEGLEVLEVSLTGVARAAKKDADFIDFGDIAPAQQKNMVFASTIITNGIGRAVVCETGEDTLVSVMKKNMPVLSHERLKILDSLKKFCSAWTVVMSALIIVMTVIDLALSLNTQGIFEVFTTGLALSVASMSEFFVAFGYVILACGVFGAVRRYRDVNTGALVRNSAKLETVKELTTLIVPKEGAFAVKDMRLESVWANGDYYKPGEHGYHRNCARTLRYALISTGLYGAKKLIANNASNENIYTSEEDAIISAADACGEFNVELENKYPMVQHMPKSDINRFETTLVRYENEHAAVIRGEYNAVLDCCRYYTEYGRVYELTPEKREELKISGALMTKEAFRVIGVATKNTIYNNLQRIVSIQTDMTFEGMLCLNEPMLPGAAKSVSRCRAAGIKVIMLTSDVAENNRCLASALGVLGENDRAVTSNELSRMKEGIYRADIDKYRLYEGLNTAQKRMLLRCLQENGEKVGVLGVELDDIILLKEADVGYAESLTISERAGKGGYDITSRKLPVYRKNSAYGAKTGCEALKFISDVIISEADRNGSGGFNAIVESIMFSKVIYLNLWRMAKYLISSQISRLFIVLYSVLSGETMLTPTQIIFSGLIVDFAAVLIIAFEKPSLDILKEKAKTDEMLSHPFRSNPQSVLIGLFWAVASVLMPKILMQYGIIASGLQMTSALFLSLLLTQLAILNESMRETGLFEQNLRINGVYIVSVLTVTACIAVFIFVPPIGAMFGVVALQWKAWLGIIALPLLMTLIFEIYKLIAKSSEKIRR